MKKVITYGTYDLLHYGHIRLLERAKALGDYLIVGITSDAFDKTRGKINVQQSLIERIEAVKATGLADQIVVEEYEGQKIDDIKKFGVNIFAIGSDWKGKFDYLNEYCEVVYLDRTKGISSSELRSENNLIKIGLLGDTHLVDKYIYQSQFVNGVEIVGICSNQPAEFFHTQQLEIYTNSLDELIDKVDAFIVASNPSDHFDQISKLLSLKKHVLCESPLSVNKVECTRLYELAEENNVQLFDSIKTAYATAFERLILLAKGGKIGDIVSIDVTCTSLFENLIKNKIEYKRRGSLLAWGPTALFPIFQLLGTNYKTIDIVAHLDENGFDHFDKINFIFDNAVASVLVGKKIKSEGDLVIAGTKGYIYVAAPWWKTDYFEIRYENQADNKRYFYQLDGEGIKNEIAAFSQSIKFNLDHNAVSREISEAISEVISIGMDKNQIQTI